MDGCSPIWIILAVAILFVLTVIVYLYSSAVQSINENELEEIKEKNEKTYQKVDKIINDPARFINTVQEVSVLITLITGICIGFRIDKVLLRIGMAVLWVIILLVFGIIIPKKLGSRHSKGISLKLTNITYMMTVVLMPVTFCVSKIADMILKISGIDPNEPEENVTEEDIISVINEGHVQGVLLASEAEMINNIVEFGDKEAKDIMTHRTAMVCVDGEMLLCDAAEYILGLNNSRFPVYIENIDNIIGIVNFRDIMSEAQREVNDMKKISDIPGLVRKASFVPETKKINVLFKTMQSEKIHMAIVVDEYGQTSGIVAMEDILEEIVGNILDEYDEEDVNIVRREDGAYVVKGSTPLEEIEEKLHIKFDEDCETINGYLVSKFERILENDERPEIVIDNVKYKVLSVKNRMISVVLITLSDDE
ncbi:MAG: HlyC/CorC family transporter [Clostridiales bacterium]|uniref:hemolysin family protein n=1 Tax=Bovifimicola ammoniilytica TaxID=2981720 RepID=UPI000821E465|nr:hemolysin family protein [Bovifimicola ammoniilytica]MBD8943019.1 HlyC/CorC family transporter [Clostridiales bacterium]MCU6752683.1 hemolysin family protein [Bovifimicola ammoniilytica]SCJ33177.1 Magnesium and cobalt efflux protein CorC [uncultured Eubacterium sp.]